MEAWPKKGMDVQIKKFPCISQDISLVCCPKAQRNNQQGLRAIYRAYEVALFTIQGSGDLSRGLMCGHGGVKTGQGGLKASLWGLSASLI